MESELEYPGLSKAVAYVHWPPIEIQTQESTDVTNHIFETKLGWGLSARVYRNGVFKFEFTDPDYVYTYLGPGSSENAIRDRTSEVSEIANRRAIILNCHLMCLYSSLGEIRLFQIMVVDPTIMVNFSSLDSKDVRIPSTLLLHNKSMARQLYDAFDIPELNGESAQNHTPVSIPLEVVASSFEKLNAILDHPEKHLPNSIHVLAQSSIFFQKHDFSSSLITSWAVIEMLLHAMWGEFIDEQNKRQTPENGEKFINSKRRDTLTGIGFTASMVTEMLSLQGLISFKTYKNLTIIRKARNEWIHKLSPVELSTAALSKHTACDLLEEVYGIKLSIPTNLVWGF